jgi:excisionase family DNA binding protein
MPPHGYGARQLRRGQRLRGGLMSRGLMLGRGIVDALDDEALDGLASRLTPRVKAILEQPDDGWLDAPGAASYLGVSLNTLYKLTAARAVPFAQDGPGCKLWFRRGELDRWREGGSTGPENASRPLPQRRRGAS